MIFGDPLKFAIHCDLVSEWNDDYFFVNGIYSVFANGKLLNKGLYVTELKFALANIETNVLKKLKRLKTKSNIVCSEVKLILEDDYCINLSSQDMEDDNIYVYCVLTERNDFIFIKNECGEYIYSYPLGYVKNILKDIVKWKSSINIDW